MATQLLGPMRGDFWKTRAKPDQISEVRYTVQRPAEKTYRFVAKKHRNQGKGLPLYPKKRS